MRKLFVWALALGVCLALGGVAMADPACEEDSCVSTDEAGLGDVPIGAVVAVGGSGVEDGYVFADGEDRNAQDGDVPPELDVLDGYIGVSGADGGPVAEGEGDFNRAGGNSPLDPTQLIPQG